MNELREDLDRALRTVTFGAAPVEPAKRDGRRIRARRRVAVLAGALAVAGVAAGYPALTGTPSAAPVVPASGQHPSAAPRDPVLRSGDGGATTEGPTGLTTKNGVVASGSIGSQTWRVSIKAAGTAGAQYCFTFSPPVAASPGPLCNPVPDLKGQDSTGKDPAAFTGLATMTPAAGTGAGHATTPDLTIGESAADVAYFFVTFTDGQQLKLIPVTAGGHRYIAWAAPSSMKVARVDAYLGAPYDTNGLVATAVPFSLPGDPLQAFGLWQGPGLPAAPPRASAVLGHGTTGGQAWQVTAYEGPWGTCFVGEQGGYECVPSARLTTTRVIGGWGGNPAGLAAFGSAAPGVATVRVKLSDGTTVSAKPVAVGNERLFAFPVGIGVTPASWVAYDASGHPAGTGTTSSAATASR